MIKKWTLPFFSLFCLAGPAWAWNGKVTHVPDGDSLTVTGPDQAPVHLRLYGIDAPESRQPFGSQAKRRLLKLASRRTVEVEPVETDRYGRTVALVWLENGTLVNEVLVAEGYAWVYGQYCHKELCQGLRGLEDQARQRRLGLWAEADPQPPADWRREHKAEEWYKAPVRAVKTIARQVKVIFRH